ncbi:MAG: hypothetical protein ABH851_05270 [Methanobacteriota archaeon]
MQKQENSPEHKAVREITQAHSTLIDDPYILYLLTKFGNVHVEKELDFAKSHRGKSGEPTVPGRPARDLFHLTIFGRDADKIQQCAQYARAVAGLDGRPVSTAAGEKPDDTSVTLTDAYDFLCHLRDPPAHQVEKILGQAPDPKTMTELRKAFNLLVSSKRRMLQTDVLDDLNLLVENESDLRVKFDNSGDFLVEVYGSRPGEAGRLRLEAERIRAASRIEGEVVVGQQDYVEAAPMGIVEADAQARGIKPETEEEFRNKCRFFALVRRLPPEFFEDVGGS